ncbi:16S rRNA (cytidine(1402)-2'-O)-methyltransferase [Patescibacteria group bacterium]|nr:16S rRNA (cytidine(1402)-2'-O)-methyltransferase [Patescibacteria group bacterium]
MPGILHIVATPIGNLDDITKRAIDTLSTADLILCEDTRVTKKLLNAYNISKPVQSLHQHSDDEKIKSIIKSLNSDQSIALVSDAGTPGVNDPGGKLVATALNQGITVSPIPGPSALTTAISVCGFPMEKFTYLGFPPNKKGRKTFFEDVMSRDEASIFFESTHRLIKALESMMESVQDTKEKGRLVCVCREMTKIYETIYRGPAEKVLIDLKNSSVKGESVIIVAPKKYKE